MLPRPQVRVRGWGRGRGRAPGGRQAQPAPAGRPPHQRAGGPHRAGQEVGRAELRCKNVQFSLIVEASYLAVS